MPATFEIYQRGCWHPAAQLHPSRSEEGLSGGRQLEHLPQVMNDCKVDADIIGQRALSIQNHCRQLLNLQEL